MEWIKSLTWGDWLSIAAFVISCIALFVDLPIKRMTKQNMKEEREAKKRADIVVRPIKGLTNAIRVEFENCGRAIARNIDVKIVNDRLKDEPEAAYFQDDSYRKVFPYLGELGSGDKLDCLLVCYLVDTKIELNISWTDKSGERKVTRWLQNKSVEFSGI